MLLGARMQHDDPVDNSTSGLAVNASRTHMILPMTHVARGHSLGNDRIHVGLTKSHSALNLPLATHRRYALDLDLEWRTSR